VFSDIAACGLAFEVAEWQAAIEFWEAAMTTESSSANPTPERLMQFAFGFAPPLMLEAAVRHGAFDALRRGPQTAAEVSVITKTSERGMRILLNALVGLELLGKDAEGRYTLTPESELFLVSSSPRCLGGFFKHTSTQLIPHWLNLTEIVRTGKPDIAVNQQGPGSEFFQDFVADLFPLNYGAAKALGEHLRIADAKQPIHVLDLAAGSGVWSIGLAHLSPQVRVTAVDWPGVLAATRRVTERHAVAERYRFVAGDLLEVDFGTGHHIATLGHILHSEGEARSRQLIRKVFDALAPGGTVAIGEWLVNDERSGPPGSVIFAVNMLVNTETGDAFSFNEIARWLDEAGFRNPRLVEAPSISPLVLANRP
jgi:ubiquinone/menaquinone biosynthesis C-methylase UbiE